MSCLRAGRQVCGGGDASVTLAFDWQLAGGPDGGLGVPEGPGAPAAAAAHAPSRHGGRQAPNVSAITATSPSLSLSPHGADTHTDTHTHAAYG